MCMSPSTRVEKMMSARGKGVFFVKSWQKLTRRGWEVKIGWRHLWTNPYRTDPSWYTLWELYYCDKGNVYVFFFDSNMKAVNEFLLVCMFNFLLCNIPVFLLYRSLWTTTFSVISTIVYQKKWSVICSSQVIHGLIESLLEKEPL